MVFSFQVDGLGTYSLSVIYASLVVSCAFLPTAVIKRLKCKWAMVVCMLCYTTYIAAQFYPEFYTLIPAAIILGMGAAPMWSAKCTYLTQVRRELEFILCPIKWFARGKNRLSPEVSWEHLQTGSGGV